MKITILTLFPEMFEGFLTTSIIKRAIAENKVEIDCVNIRDFTLDKHNHVDDTPYGGGKGMVIQCQPVMDCLHHVKTPSSKIIITAASGQVFNQAKARELSREEHCIIVCGHYEGFDARIIEEADEVLSIGDYILTGGELAAMVISDAIIRLCDGVIQEESHMDESFENGLLEYPQYTKPPVYNGKEVPAVLLSGHHEKIRQWRLKESIRVTQKNRPDLMTKKILNDEEKKLLRELIDENKVDN